jgi:hypothetical protein
MGDWGTLTQTQFTHQIEAMMALIATAPSASVPNRDAQLGSEQKTSARLCGFSSIPASHPPPRQAMRDTSLGGRRALMGDSGTGKLLASSSAWVGQTACQPASKPARQPGVSPPRFHRSRPTCRLSTLVPSTGAPEGLNRVPSPGAPLTLAAALRGRIPISSFRRPTPFFSHIGDGLLQPLPTAQTLTEQPRCAPDPSRGFPAALFESRRAGCIQIRGTAHPASL